MQCSGQPVLPLGMRDEIGIDTVKIFCPKCQNVYHPPPVRSRSNHHGSSSSTGVDGASFGTTFPHLFLMTFSNLVPDPLPEDSAYVPRVFGFRVHQSARQRNVIAPNRPDADGDQNGESRRTAASRRNNNAAAAGRPNDNASAAAQPSVREGRSQDGTRRNENNTDRSPKRRTDVTRRSTGEGGDNNNGVIENTAKRRKRADNS